MAQARATEGSTPSSSGTHHQQGNVGPAAPRPRGMLLEVQDTSLPETGGETTLACRTKHHSQQLPEATRPPACLLWAGSTCPQRGHISAANGLRSHQVRPERTQSLMSVHSGFPAEWGFRTAALPSDRFSVLGASSLSVSRAKGRQQRLDHVHGADRTSPPTHPAGVWTLSPED